MFAAPYGGPHPCDSEGRWPVIVGDYECGDMNTKLVISKFIRSSRRHKVTPYGRYFGYHDTTESLLLPVHESLCIAVLACLPISYHPPTDPVSHAIYTRTLPLPDHHYCSNRTTESIRNGQAHGQTRGVFSRPLPSESQTAFSNAEPVMLGEDLARVHPH